MNMEDSPLEKRDKILAQYSRLHLDEGGGMNYLSDDELSDRIRQKEFELEQENDKVYVLG